MRDIIRTAEHVSRIGYVSNTPDISPPALHADHQAAVDEQRERSVGGGLADAVFGGEVVRDGQWAALRPLTRGYPSRYEVRHLPVRRWHLLLPVQQGKVNRTRAYVSNIHAHPLTILDLLT